MRKGFTLIELLLVVVIIGIVASFVLPKFGDVKAKAYKAAMKSDLRNLATAEEIYFDAGNGYALTQILPATQDGIMRTSDFVTLSFVPIGTDGYTATASHGKLDPANTCSLSIGVGQANKVVCP